MGNDEFFSNGLAKARARRVPGSLRVAAITYVLDDFDVGYVARCEIIRDGCRIHGGRPPCSIQALPRDDHFAAHGCKRRLRYRSDAGRGFHDGFGTGIAAVREIFFDQVIVQNCMQIVAYVLDVQ